MSPQRPSCTYLETRLDLEPLTQATTISIRLPTSLSSTSFSGVQQPRFIVASVPSIEDETAFRRRNIAIASSIFHRRYFKSPRSFLWRVLENKTVLSISVVDFSAPENSPESRLTLRLTFPHLILPNCIAFSDSEKRDVLNVYVLTESKLLWALTIRPEFFCKAQSIDENISNWCDIYSPRSLVIKNPHRLVALMENELLISFHDGALARLGRNDNLPGSPWDEQQYNDGGWGHSLRSIVPFQNNSGIYYEGHYMQPCTAISIASPVTIINNIPFVFTVTIDHRLRVWNLAQGKIAYTGDILTQVPEPQEGPKHMIDPSQSRLVQVISEFHGITCITYSPHGLGGFKFWDVTADIDGRLKLSDLTPETVLIPHAPSADIWTVADFSAVFDKSQKNLHMWVLWKNNVTFQLMKLECLTRYTEKQLKYSGQAWQRVALDQVRDIPIPKILSCDPSDVTDKWLEFILFPGRFSTATIETGLVTYEQGLGIEKEASNKSRSLVDWMCTSIASTVELPCTSDGRLGFEQFRSATHSQWMRFYRLLIDLHEQRGEALSLIIDPEGQTPWVLLADGISIIRECSKLEKIWHNLNTTERNDIVSNVLFAAKSFRNSFGDNLSYACNSLLLEEVHQESPLSIGARIIQFYEKSDFENQIGDEEYEELLGNLDGHFKHINPIVLTDIIELLSFSRDFDRDSLVLPLTRFGNKILVKGVQQIVQLYRCICVDQLILLIYAKNLDNNPEETHIEENDPEDGIPIETAPTYNQLLKILSRLELIHWLTITQISLPDVSTEALSSVTAYGKNVTIFEGILPHLFSLKLREDQKMSSLVTEILLQICTADGGFEISPAEIQCFLLKHNRPDLAMECSRFAYSDSFSIYILGRVYLAVGEGLKAAVQFRKAAAGLALPNSKQRIDLKSAGYLNESEKSLLNVGLSKYYSHIVALFEEIQFHSYVIEFAQLSLQFIRAGTSEDDLRTKMQVHLFEAALQTTRYELAHSTLALITNTSLQYLSLSTLVTRICETSNTTNLMKLPFFGLQDKVDDILCQKCQNITDVSSGIPYHKILYAWRIKYNNFRGAAAILLDRLRRLQLSKDADDMVESYQLETPVTQLYISIINTLCCVDPKQAWILFETEGLESHPHQGQLPKRKVITLSDLRKEYQAELDRLAAIHSNQIQFEGSATSNILST
ncbi:Nucleoporin NUP120 [Golovinomyces cichoracearum]|uniref:Nucleoporin NUP120 n=1 Tax=Golovinomyces cichoracearum TaxID=62708 RepID=A0A420J8N2_9PEZI|nr:Nucleoporin NUP120 [Golovinomyces cichoracearum]